MPLKRVEICISNQMSGNDFYCAKSYPHTDKDRNGRMDTYSVPVYFLFIKGKDENDILKIRVWKVLRFMPYWNDPLNYDNRYRQKGWTVAGLHKLPLQKVSEYKKDYSVHSATTIYKGAIVLKGSFYIHAGPDKIPDATNAIYGSAGCVEVIGDFNLFKEDIRELSGSDNKIADDAIEELIRKGLLYVQIEQAPPPDLLKRIIQY